MRKEERRKYTDPVDMKIEEWLQGKERNVRGLLCTLHTVLWEGAKWTPVTFADLMEAYTLKKAYQKACLLIHPDRVGTDNPNHRLAQEIFIKLSAAHKAYEEDEVKGH